MLLRSNNSLFPLYKTTQCFKVIRRISLRSQDQSRLKYPCWSPTRFLPWLQAWKRAVNPSVSRWSSRSSARSSSTRTTPVWPAPESAQVKGTVSWDRFKKIWQQFTELGSSDFQITSNIFFPVNAKITQTAYVPLSDWFCSWTTGKPFVPMQCHFMSNQSEAASVLCKPKGARLWASTSSRPTIST